MKKPALLLADDHLYTPHEVAEYLRIAYDTVVRACRSGHLPAVKVGGKWRISDADLRVYLNKTEDASPALREAPTDATLAGKPRQRRAPLPPRPTGPRPRAYGEAPID